MKNIEIRKINETDLRTLAELDVDTFGDGDNERAHKVFLHSFNNRIADACLVAEKAGAPVGAVLVKKRITWTPDTAYVVSLFVRKEFQGRGIGKMLLEKCLVALKSAGIKNVELTVEMKNKAAISLYEKEGFELFRYLYTKRL